MLENCPMMLFPKQLKPLMFAQMRKRGRVVRSVFAFLTGVAATLIFPPYAGRWEGYVALIAFWQCCWENIRTTAGSAAGRTAVGRAVVRAAMGTEVSMPERVAGRIMDAVVRKIATARCGESGSVQRMSSDFPFMRSASPGSAMHC